jgi:hypothetical protein
VQDIPEPELFRRMKEVVTFQCLEEMWVVGQPQQAALLVPVKWCPEEPPQHPYHL